MVWGKASDRVKHATRSKALTAHYQSPAGMPVYDRARMGLGSRGGAPIWVMREAWMPNPFSKNKSPGGERKNRPCTCPDPMCKKHGFDRQRTGGAFLKSHFVEVGADPDGFAVFGRYPKGFLAHVLKLRLLGDVRRDEILHVCSGTLGPTERWTIDVRREARPMVQASGTALPLKDGSFRAVMLDPPYSDQYARNLYGVENPRPSWLLREAARILQGGGKIGILHVAVPFVPDGCRLVNCWGITTGVGFRIRAFTVYEKEQERML